MRLIERLIDSLTPALHEARVYVIQEDGPLADAVRQAALPADLRGIAEFRDVRDRELARLSRGLFRIGAAALQSCDPVEARITRDRTGRPGLAGCSRTLMDLNVSKRSGCVAIVLSRGGACGIDIETLEYGDSATSVLKALRTRGVIEASEQSYEHALIRWCGYEACLKADGRGLQDGIDCVSPHSADLSGAPIIWGCGGKRWGLQTIPVPVGFVGVVACAEGLRVQYVPTEGAGMCCG